MKSVDRSLRIFISYASQDIAAARVLYQRLKSEPWIEPWFDKENLLPGQDWNLEITKGLRAADVIIVCLSKESVAKEGYVQKEFKRAVDFADEKPEGTIYVIPLRLDDCITPSQFLRWQWVDYFASGAHERLLKSLIARANELEVPIFTVEFRGKDGVPVQIGQAVSMEMMSKASPEIKAILAESAPDPAPAPAENLDLYRFIKIASRAVPQPFWIAKYPVTNAQYERFLKSDDFTNPDFWTGFQKFSEICQPIGDWGDEGLSWLKEQLKDYEYFPPEKLKVVPRYWQDAQFGITKPDNPVVGVTWFEVNAYCKWLAAHWEGLPEQRANLDLKPALLRLPLETEWVAATGGEKPAGRYPWDLPGQATTDEKEIAKRANVANKISHTTPVTAYPNGGSPFGVMDLAGNVWEWQANFYDKGRDFPALRGGSWLNFHDNARVAGRSVSHPVYHWLIGGFRVAAFAK